MPVVPTPISGGPYDLVSAAVAIQQIAAGGITLTAAQLAALPMAITSASKAIVRYCGRPFVSTAYTEVIAPEGGRQDRGEVPTARLSYFPVQSITSIKTGRSTVLTVANTDTATNQFASVVFAYSGDVEFLSLVNSGLVLTRTASAVDTTATLSFATYPTVQALGTAINALGGGWTATVATGTPSPGLMGSAALVGAQTPKGAIGSPGVGLDLFTQAAGDCHVDPRTGIATFAGSGSWGAGGWDGGWNGNWDWGGSWGGVGPQYRIDYVAGFATIPENVAEVCAELAKITLERLRIDGALKSESAKDYSYTLQDNLMFLPDWALQVLGVYKDWKV